jgi:hypothetical protein
METLIAELTLRNWFTYGRRLCHACRPTVQSLSSRITLCDLAKFNLVNSHMSFTFKRITNGECAYTYIYS